MFFSVTRNVPHNSLSLICWYTIWPEAFGCLKITPICDCLIPWALICFYKSFHSTKGLPPESEPDYFHSAIRALVRSDTDVGQQGLAHDLCSSSSQIHWVGLRSGLFVWGHCRVETGRGHPLAVVTKLKQYCCLKYFVCCSIKGAICNILVKHRAVST